MSHEEETYEVNENEGYERTEPDSKIIFGFAVATVVTLVVLQGAFKTYFESHVAREYANQVADAPSLLKDGVEADQAALVSGAKTSIAEAKKQLAAGGRGSVELVRPQQSTDTAAQAGWSFHPDFVAPEAAPADSEAAAADGEAAPADGEAAPADGEAAPAAE